MLHDVYGVPNAKIAYIPHGIPDVPFVDPASLKEQFAMEGRRVLLTFVRFGSLDFQRVAAAVSPLAPGIFTLNNQGTGQGAIQINNTALVAAPSSGGSRPAHPGEFVVVYCTGLGAVANPPGSRTSRTRA